MKKMAMLVMFAFVAAGAIDSGAAGWVDPFGGGGSKGFVDPFGSTPKQSPEDQDAKSEAKRKKQEQRAATKEAKKKDQLSRQPGTRKEQLMHELAIDHPVVTTNAPKPMKPSELVKYYDGQIDKIEKQQKKDAKKARRDEEDPPFDPEAKSITDISAPGVSKELVAQIRELKQIYEQMQSKFSDKRLTPYGVLLGQSYQSAKRSLSTLMEAGARCKDGDVFYTDPANACFAVLLHGEPGLAGSRDEKVTGASMWLSKQCLKDDPNYDTLYKFMSRLGMQEYQDGWTTGYGIEGCLAAVKKTPDDMMPRLFGEISMAMPYDLLTRGLANIGLKKVKNYSNGGEFTLDGSRLLIEYCNYGGKKLISYLAMDVGKESERVARFMDAMKIHKSLIESRSATLRSQRGQNGRITKFEYHIRGHELKCKAGVS